MGRHSSYWLYQKYEKRGDQDWIPSYPNTYSISGDSENPMPLVVRIEHDRECGWICDEVERWVEIPISEDFICDDCEVGFETRCNVTSAFTYFGDYRYEVFECQYRYEQQDGSWSEWLDLGRKYDNPQKVAKKGVFGMASGEILEVTCGDDYGNYSPTLSFDENFTSRYTIQYEYYPEVAESGYTHFCNGYLKPHPRSCGCSEPKPFVVTSITVGDCVENVDTSYISSLEEVRLSPTVKSFTGSVGKRLYVDTLTQWLNMILDESVDGSGNIAFTPSFDDRIPPYITLYVNNVPTTNIVIPSGITEVKNLTFENFTVTSVTIPDTVTKIGTGSFWNCALSSLTIPDSVESIGEGAFTMNDYSNVTIGTGLTSMYCNSIQGNAMTITFQSVNPPTIITRYEGECVVNFGNNPIIFVPSGSVEYYQSEWGHYARNIFPIGQQLEFAVTLISNELDTSIMCPSLSTDNTLSRNDIINWSANTDASITVYDCVTSLGDATFSGFTELKSVDLSQSSISAISFECFAQCSGLTSVTIPDSVTSISNLAFSGYPLSTIDIPSGVTHIGNGAFENSKLTGFTFPSGVTTIGNNVLAFCHELEEVTIPEGVTTISSDAFCYSEKLRTIEFPSTVTYFGLTSLSNCDGLLSITFRGATPPTFVDVPVSHVSCPIYVPCESVDAYKNALTRWGSDRVRPIDYSCRETRWVDVGETCVGYDKYNLQVMEYRYGTGGTWTESSTYRTGDTLIEADSPDCGFIPSDYYIKVEYPSGTLSAKTCNGHSQVTLSDITFGESGYTKCWIGSCDSGTPVTSLANNLFRNNKVIEEITLPYTVQSIGTGTCQWCSSLTSVTLSDNLTSIGNYAFQYCSGLTEANIPSGVTTIGNYAFAACSSLSSFDIPNGVTSLGSGACQFCHSLSSVTIPNSVSSIGAYCFERSSGLTSVTIGSGVGYIGRAAFWGCSGLTGITCLATTPPTLYNPSDTDVFTKTNCPIYVPCESYDRYIAASGWSKLASRIQPIDTTCRETRWVESGYTCNGCDKTPTEVEQVRYGTGGTWTNTGNQRTGQVQFDSEDCGCGTKFIFEYNDGTSYSSTCVNHYVDSSDVNYNSKKNNMVSAYINGECVSGISQSSFGSMQNLSSITITEGVTTIGSDSFTDSTKLKTVDLPSTLTKISYRAFMRCSSLSTVICRAITPPTLDGYDVFSVNASNRKIYVPAESVNTYKNSSKWGSYPIEAIPNS